MFFDLNLPVRRPTESVERIGQMLELMIRFGYYGVALNHVVELKSLPKNASEIKLPQFIEKYLPPKIGPIYEESVAYTRPPPNCALQTAIRQYTRITIIVEDTAATYKLTASNSVLQAYDIVAVQPTTEKVFQAACKDAEVDIISLDLSGRLPFYLKHSTVGTAIQRGIYFEICYTPAIRDASARRNLISNARSLIRATRGKNILVSSEAQKLLDIRSPHDTISICTLFGMSPDEAHKTISANPSHVLYHAYARKNVYRSVISVDDSVLPHVDNSSVPKKRKAVDD